MKRTSWNHVQNIVGSLSVANLEKLLVSLPKMIENARLREAEVSARAALRAAKAELAAVFHELHELLQGYKALAEQFNLSPDAFVRVGEEQGLTLSLAFEYGGWVLVETSSGYKAIFLNGLVEPGGYGYSLEGTNLGAIFAAQVAQGDRRIFQILEECARQIKERRHEIAASIKTEK